MSTITIIQGNSNDKDNTRAYMVKGEKGYSAYDLYVQEGGTMTEEEWLDAFLNANNFYNKSEVNTLLDAKADEATTLAGYGITDSYTKTETDGLISDVVTDSQSTSTTKAYSANYINELQTYSTEETIIAKWIDGKPIYRKVVNTGTLPNAQSKTVAHNISNLKRIIKIYGNAHSTSTGTIYPLPITNTENVQYQVALRVDTTDITLATGVDRSYFDESYVVLEYTKTTD